jgi:hypothetical protein
MQLIPGDTMRRFNFYTLVVAVVTATALWAQTIELAYDDGNRVFTTNFQAPQRGGVLFQPEASTYPFRVLWVRVWYSTPGSYQVHLLTNTHLGMSDGDDQVTPFSYNATQTADWDTIDFQPYQVTLSEDFLFGGRWSSTVPQIWGDGSGSGHFWRDNGVGWFIYTAMDPLIRATIETNTGVQIELPPTPVEGDFLISGVYPNPWNSEARVRIEIARPQEVSLGVYDLCGRRVKTLWQGVLSTGHHDIRLHGEKLATGTYFITGVGALGESSATRCVIIR